MGNLKENQQRVENGTFYTVLQIDIAKSAERILTADISRRESIKKIAERLSVSETSLKNYFRGVFGQNISDYLRDIRMNTAAGLLTETQISISEISTQVGYVNQGKFAIVFKKQFGLSPLEYRRSRRLD